MTIHRTTGVETRGKLEVEDDLARLVRAAARADESAWNALVVRFSPMIHRVARSHGLQAADADDVTEATWLRLVQTVDRIHDARGIVGWLTVTAHRESLRVLRDQRRESMLEIDDIAETLTEPDELGERVERDEARAVVNRALATLPDRQRALLEMVFAEDAASYADISTRLGIPVGSIGPTRNRALERLRRDPKVAQALEALL